MYICIYLTSPLSVPLAKPKQKGTQLQKRPGDRGPVEPPGNPEEPSRNR